VTGTPPPYNRIARLRELKDDLLGWGSIDLGILLAAWGYESSELGVSYGVTQVLWTHPSERGRLQMVLASTQNVGVSKVNEVIWLCEEAHKLGS